MSIRRVSTAAAVGAMLALAASPTLAQETDDGSRDRGPMVFATGGGFSPLRDVTERGLNFDRGYNFGGGLGFQLNRNLAFRVGLNYASSEIDESSISVPDDQFTNAARGRDFDRYYMGADFQLRYPTDVGLAPYVVLGGGAVRVSPDVQGMDSFTRPAGKVGAGLSYNLPNTGLALFAEWDGWVYTWDDSTRLDVPNNNPNKTQFDTMWSGGLRLAF